MAKRKSSDILKKIKIDKAQQNMLGAVAGTAFILGASLVLGVYFLRYIRFDMAIIGAKNEAIEGYSDAIKSIGVCKAPRRTIYTDKELESCDPNDVYASDVPGTLRAEIMENMAGDENLENVSRDGLSICTNSATGEKLSYQQLMRRYENSTTDEEKTRNFQIFAMCTALRIIPDALPAAKNELALMASVNKIFNISGWAPESLAPGMDKESTILGLGALGVNLEMQTDTATVVKVMRNLEKSIREIDVNSIEIEWSGGILRMTANATAYYAQTAELTEGIMTVRGDGKVTRTIGEVQE